jgi:hypothetical protein
MKVLTIKLILTFIIIGYTTFSFSQSDFFKDRDADLELGFNAKYNLTTAEFGVNFAKVYGGMCSTFASDGFIFSSEFGIKNNNFLFAPKATYTINLLFLDASFSVINYNYLNNHSLYVKPQIGATLLGYFDLVYGYNIPITDRNLDFQGSTLTLRMRLFGCMKEIK